MEFRRINTVIRHAKCKYWINTKGDTFREALNCRYSNLIDGKIKNWRFKSRVKKDLETLDGIYKKVNYEGNDFTLLSSGELLIKMIPTHNIKGHFMVSYHDILSKRHYIAIHRLIVLVFNREMELNEVVHHLDHNKLNNNIENLIIMDTSHHLSYHKNYTLNKKEKYSKILKKYGI